MTMLKQAVDVLETLYPLRYAEEWDEPGLIVGDLAAPVTRIAFAADPTAAVVGEAVARGADLLVCHHPLLFRSVHQVSGAGVRGDIVRTLYRNDCALWVGHTNADAAYRGVGQAAADRFGLIDQHPLVPIRDESAAAAGHEAGLGRVGRLPGAMPFEAFARRVAEVLPHTELGVQACGPLGQMVETVAVLPGSGDSLFDEVRAAGVDVYVTSDLRHHPATDAIEQALRGEDARGRHHDRLGRRARAPAARQHAALRHRIAVVRLCARGRAPGDRGGDRRAARRRADPHEHGSVEPDHRAVRRRPVTAARRANGRRNDG